MYVRSQLFPKMNEEILQEQKKQLSDHHLTKILEQLKSKATHCLYHVPHFKIFQERREERHKLRRPSPYIHKRQPEQLQVSAQDQLKILRMNKFLSRNIVSKSPNHSNLKPRFLLTPDRPMNISKMQPSVIKNSLQKNTKAMQIDTVVPQQALKLLIQPPSNKNQTKSYSQGLKLKPLMRVATTINSRIKDNPLRIQFDKQSASNDMEVKNIQSNRPEDEMLVIVNKKKTKPRHQLTIRINGWQIQEEDS